MVQAYPAMVDASVDLWHDRLLLCFAVSAEAASVLCLHVSSCTSEPHNAVRDDLVWAIHEVVSERSAENIGARRRGPVAGYRRWGSGTPQEYRPSDSRWLRQSEARIDLRKPLPDSERSNGS